MNAQIFNKLLPSSGIYFLLILSQSVFTSATFASDLQPPLIDKNAAQAFHYKIQAIFLGGFWAIALTFAAQALMYKKSRHILQALYIALSAWPAVLLICFDFYENVKQANLATTLQLFGLGLIWIAYYRFPRSFNSVSNKFIRRYAPSILFALCIVALAFGLITNNYYWPLMAHIIVLSSIGCIQLYQYFFSASDNFSFYVGLTRLLHSFAIGAFTYLQHEGQINNFTYLLSISIINAIDLTITLPLILVASIKRSQQHAAKSLNAARKEAHIAAIEPLLNRTKHDIRSPITDIISLSELVIDTPLNQQQRIHMIDIQRSARTALDKLNAFFLIQDPSNKQDKEFSHKEPFNIYQVVSECASYYANYAERHSVEIITNIDDEVAEYWQGNPRGVRQILMHIFDHLLAHKKASVVMLNAGIDPDEKLMVSIKHINKDEIVTILNDDTSNFQVAKNIVNELGGTLIKSLSNSMHEIKLAFPFHPLSTKSVDPYNEQILTGRRLLIVDDNATCREALSQHAEKWGMEVHTASSYHETLAVMHHQTLINKPIEIVLLDYIMPGKNGLDIARDIIRDPKIEKSFFTIMMTSATIDVRLHTSAEHNIRRLLEKPVLAQTLKQSIYEEISLPQRLQEHNVEYHNQHTTLHENINALIVEDEPISSTIVKNMLQKLGVRCTICTDGSEAITVLNQAEQPFNLVLLDCELPGASGYTVARERRDWEKEHKTQPIAILAMTAHDSTEAINRSKSAGMNAHLTKPIELKQLKTLIFQHTKHLESYEK